MYSYSRSISFDTSTKSPSLLLILLGRESINFVILFKAVELPLSSIPIYKVPPSVLAKAQMVFKY